jgi:hypothetical protein
MIIARSWVYLESVSSVSTGGNSRGGGDGKIENNVVVVEATTVTIGNTKAAQRLLTTTFLAHACTCKLLMHHQPLYSHINPSLSLSLSLSLNPEAFGFLEA